mmetsp:Transcript_18336/g.51366  ORF Transcript_18336/g.51366 Transcript_18336/m.51366 type:complete len:254 (+) Transcript_18336:2866-3627(+)
MCFSFHILTLRIGGVPGPVSEMASCQLTHLLRLGLGHVLLAVPRSYTFAVTDQFLYVRDPLLFSAPESLPRSSMLAPELAGLGDSQCSFRSCASTGCVVYYDVISSACGDPLWTASSTLAGPNKVTFPLRQSGLDPGGNNRIILPAHWLWPAQVPSPQCHCPLSTLTFLLDWLRGILPARSCSQKMSMLLQSTLLFCHGSWIIIAWQLGVIPHVPNEHDDSRVTRWGCSAIVPDGVTHLHLEIRSDEVVLTDI